jgi:hypothetical protein
MDSSEKKEIVKFGSHELTEAQKDAIAAYLNPIDKVSGGVRFLPLICYDDRCRYKAHCPLHLLKLPRPTGDPCSVEISQLQNTQKEYIEELQIQPEDYTDRRQVDMLALLETLINRAMQELSTQDGSIAIDVPVGTDAKGRPVYSKTLHPSVLALEKAMAARARILKDLVATRAAKKTVSSKESAQEVFDKIRHVIDKVDEEAEKHKDKLGGYLDADFRVVDEQ